MIGRLVGTVIECHPPRLLLDVNGVGYELEVPTTVMESVGQSEKATFFTHLVVREDAHSLYGFHKKAVRDFFRLLIKVNGVGPKLALAILSGMSPRDFAEVVLAEDVARLVELPGVGKKMAERLVVEMRSSVEDWASDITLPANPSSMTSQMAMDATNALVALGYKPGIASKAVKGCDGGIMTTEDLIKAALQQLGTVT